jgi:hypothetical protein
MKKSVLSFSKVIVLDGEGFRRDNIVYGTIIIQSNDNINVVIQSYNFK